MIGRCIVFASVLTVYRSQCSGAGADPGGARVQMHKPVCESDIVPRLLISGNDCDNVHRTTAVACARVPAYDLYR